MGVETASRPSAQTAVTSGSASGAGIETSDGPEAMGTWQAQGHGLGDPESCPESSGAWL